MVLYKHELAKLWDFLPHVKLLLQTFSFLPVTGKQMIKWNNGVWDLPTNLSILNANVYSEIPNFCLENGLSPIFSI